SNKPVLAGGRDPGRYYDPNAFAVPAPGFFGNLGRGTVIEPGVATLDLSLVKNTSVAERFTVQFRAEAFNLLNRANFGPPDQIAFNNAATGLPSGTAGQIVVTTTTARQIQFALKILI